MELDPRTQDSGGGEVQLSASRDVAVAWPVFQPTTQSVVVRSDEVGVSAVMVDVTQRQVDCALSTVSDCALVEGVTFPSEEEERSVWMVL